jgi:hypothetical protein
LVATAELMRALIACVQALRHRHAAIARVQDHPQRDGGVGFDGARLLLGDRKSFAGVETDPAAQVAYRKGLAVNAAFAVPAAETYARFDNADQGFFGTADWRAANPTWFPQPTQAEAERLAKIVDYKKRGPRKNYEATWMRHPLAAAAVIALSGDAAGRPLVLKAVSHYDYAKLNMAEFFFAECAYYALPESR